MDIYYKTTDAHRCLPFCSNHPKHCKKNIPFTLAHRICTIAENTEAKMKYLENLKMNLSKYQYPKQLTELVSTKIRVFLEKNCIHLKQYQMIIAYHS